MTPDDVWSLGTPVELESDQRPSGSPEAPDIERMMFAQMVEEFGKDPKETSEYVEQDKEEGWVDWGARQGARLGARAVEGIVGSPGNLVQAGKGLTDYFAPEDLPETRLQQMLKAAEGVLPTSESLRQRTENILPEIFEARNEQEEVADDYISLVGELYALGPKGGTAQSNLKAMQGAFKTGAILKGSDLALDNVSDLGPGQKLTAQIAGMLLYHRINSGGAQKYARDLFNEALQGIPKGARTSVKGMSSSIDNLIKRSRVGLKDVSGKGNMTKTFREMKGKIRGDSASVEELVQMKKDLRIQYNDLPESYTEARNLNLKAQELVDESLLKYGKENPNFGDPYRDSVKAYAGIRASEHAGNRIASAIRGKRMGDAFRLLFYNPAAPFAAGAYSLGSSKIALSTALGAATVKPLYSVMQRITSNPPLRRYYTQLMNAALKDNRAGIVRWGERLNKALKNDPEIQDIMNQATAQDYEMGVDEQALVP